MKRAADQSDRAALCAKNLRALNGQFCSWVQSRLQERPSDAWEADVRQYLAYVSEIQEDFDDVLAATGNAGGSAPPPANRAPPPPALQAAHQPVSMPSSVLVAPVHKPPPPAAAAPAPAASLFGMQPGGGSFMYGSAPTMSAFGGLAGAAAAGPGLNPFAFSVGGAPSLTEEEGDDEPERPPSPSVQKKTAEDDGEVQLLEQKCKLFFSEASGGKDSAWASRGFGNLQLRRPVDASAGGSARLLVRNDTGKLMLNAKLYKGIKVRLQGKSVCTTLFNAVPLASGEAPEGVPDDAQKISPVQTMLRFKTDAEATQLKELMEKHAPR